MKTKWTAITVLTLATTFLLTACGNAHSTKQTNTSTKKVVETALSSSKKKDRNSSSETQVSSSDATKDEVLDSRTEASLKENATTENGVAVSQDASQKNTSFAHLAGSWVNDQGQQISITEDGKTSDGGHLEVYSDGSIGIRSKEGFGATVFYALAGQEFPETIAPKEFTTGTDISRERLVISQSVNEMAHPFYRMD